MSCGVGANPYCDVMHSHSAKSKWRRFNRKYGMSLFVGFLVVLIIAIVAFLMYALSSTKWRERW
jgi:hypothetical protein